MDDLDDDDYNPNETVNSEQDIIRKQAEEIAELKRMLAAKNSIETTVPKIASVPTPQVPRTVSKYDMVLDAPSTGHLPKKLPSSGGFASAFGSNVSLSASTSISTTSTPSSVAQSKPASTPAYKEKSYGEMERYTHIAVTNRLVPSAAIDTMMQENVFVSINSINEGVGATYGSKWATIGVIGEIQPERVSKNQKTYLTIKICDLHLNEEKSSVCSVMIFDRLIAKVKQLGEGSLVAVIGGKVLPPLDSKKASSLPTISIFNDDQIVKLGTACDFGKCRGIRQGTDLPCGMVLNTRTGEYCRYHVSKAKKAIEGKLNNTTSVKPSIYDAADKTGSFSGDTVYVSSGPSKIQADQPLVKPVARVVVKPGGDLLAAYSKQLASRDRSLLMRGRDQFSGSVTLPAAKKPMVEKKMDVEMLEFEARRKREYMDAHSEKILSAINKEDDDIELEIEDEDGNVAERVPSQWVVAHKTSDPRLQSIIEKKVSAPIKKELSATDQAVAVFGPKASSLTTSVNQLSRTASGRSGPPIPTSKLMSTPSGSRLVDKVLNLEAGQTRKNLDAAARAFDTAASNYLPTKSAGNAEVKSHASRQMIKASAPKEDFDIDLGEIEIEMPPAKLLPSAPAVSKPLSSTSSFAATSLSATKPAPLAAGKPHPRPSLTSPLPTTAPIIPPRPTLVTPAKTTPSLAPPSEATPPPPSKPPARASSAALTPSPAAPAAKRPSSEMNTRGGTMESLLGLELSTTVERNVTAKANEKATPSASAVVMKPKELPRLDSVRGGSLLSLMSLELSSDASGSKRKAENIIPGQSVAKMVKPDVANMASAAIRDDDIKHDPKAAVKLAKHRAATQISDEAYLENRTKAIPTKAEMAKMRAAALLKQESGVTALSSADQAAIKYAEREKALETERRTAEIMAAKQTSYEDAQAILRRSEKSKRLMEEFGTPNTKEELEKVLNAKSINDNLVEEDEWKKQQGVWDVMEKQDQYDTKIATITSMEINGYHCRECGYSAEYFSSSCFDAQHMRERVKLTKRFFQCHHCKNRTTTINQKWPLRACEKCQCQTWDKCSYQKPKKGPEVQEKFLVRGIEHEFSLR